VRLRVEGLRQDSYSRLASGEIDYRSYPVRIVRPPGVVGDILSDLMAGLVGGLGFAPAGNIGEDAAMFEAVHGSAPDIAGQGIANPTGLLMSACLMLDHLGQTEAATRIRGAIDSVVLEDVARTVDMGGNATTKEFTGTLVKALA
jgi:isocitrate dehydrogenase (NAD+)